MTPPGDNGYVEPISVRGSASFVLGKAASYLLPKKCFSPGDLPFPLLLGRWPWVAGLEKKDAMYEKVAKSALLCFKEPRERL